MFVEVGTVVRPIVAEARLVHVDVEVLIVDEVFVRVRTRADVLVIECVIWKAAKSVEHEITTLIRRCMQR